MDDVQNMDRGFEPENLGVYIHDDFVDNLPTLFPFDSPHNGFQEANLTESFQNDHQIQIQQTITEPSVPTPPVVGPVVERQNQQAQTIVPTRESAEALTFVPIPLSASLLSGTPSNHPSLSAEGLMLEGAVSSLQGQDMTQTGYLNQFSDMENEDLLALQGINLFDGQNPSNPLVPNIINNNNFNGINNQPSPYPASFHPNPVQARPGIERGNSSAQFVTPQRPASFPPHYNHISNSRAAWNSRPDQNQFSAPDVYGALYAPKYTQSPQPSFTTMQNQQVGHASELQQIFDLQSQNSVRPVYPMNPRSEPHSNLQPGFVTMPPNPYQQGYRPVLPEPAAPSTATLANYGQQPIPFATTSNSIGLGSSVPPTYPPLYGNHDQHRHPQVMMPNSYGQQSGGASVQQWPQGVPNQTSSQAMSSRIPGPSRSQVPNSREAEIAPVLWSQGLPNQNSGYNQRVNTPNLQRESNTSSQAHNSRILGHSTEGTSSQVSNSGEAEIAPVSRTQPSETIRRILNMNPTRTVTHNVPTYIMQIGRGKRKYDLGNLLLSLTESRRYEPPRRGRPRKQREAGEISRLGKLQKVSSKKGKKAATTSTSQQEQRTTPNSVVVRDQSALPENPPTAPRHFVNNAYNLEFERKGVPIDPHLRLFKPPPPPPPPEN